jgi:hypothetical protein
LFAEGTVFPVLALQQKLNARANRFLMLRLGGQIAGFGRTNFHLGCFLPSPDSSDGAKADGKHEPRANGPGHQKTLVLEKPGSL